MRERRLIIEYLEGLGLLIAYFCLEPMLSHVCFIYSYAVLNKPYVIFSRFLPFFVIAVFLFRVFRNRGKINYAASGFIAFLFLCYLIPNFGNLKVWAETAIPITAYCLFILPICHEKRTLRLFVRAAADLYLVLAVINLAFKLWPTLYDFLEIWRPESFLADIENLAGFPLAMGMMFAMLDSYLNGSKWKLAVYAIVFFVSTYIMWTVAAVLGAVILVLYFIPPVRKLMEKTDALIFVGAAFLLFVLLTWMLEPIVSWEPVRLFIENVLKKDATLTGRLGIWQNVLQLFYEKPMFGYGLMDNAQTVYCDDYWGMVHAQSAYLQTLYEGGVLTLLAVAALLIYTSVKMRRSTDRGLMCIFKVTVFAFMINLAADQFFIYPWRSCCWCMICFICNFALAVKNDEH